MAQSWSSGPPLIPEGRHADIRILWPIIREAAKTSAVSPELLLALAWVLTALRPPGPKSSIQGIFAMSKATADDISVRLRQPQYDLQDPQTAATFAAFYLGRMLTQFVMPSVAVAAYVLGPGAVKRANGQVPDMAQPIVRSTMVTFNWLREHLVDILREPSAPAPPEWRLIAPPDNWQQPLPLSEEQVRLLQDVAGRLGLAVHADTDVRKLYLGLPRKTVPPKPAPGAYTNLVLPIQDATREDNGAYSGDTGLDILCPVGTPVVAAASGTILYSEAGHTPWTVPPDTPNSILIWLDKPFQYGKKSYRFTWYTHLSRLRYHIPDGSDATLHVRQGETIGWSGTGNRVPHLHFGVVADRAQTQFVSPFQLAGYFGWLKGG